MASGAIEEGRLLFAKDVTFVAGATNFAAIPPSRLPEVAFAGRSNVGKSSLINALTGRKALARVSNTPGRTRQINFFRVAERLMLADLPGYGYARVSKSESAAWTDLIAAYLHGRPNLRRVMLLIDARRGPMPADAIATDVLARAAVPFQFVLTKADAATSDERAHADSAVNEAIAARPAALAHFLVTSADKGTGIAELRATLAELARR